MSNSANGVALTPNGAIQTTMVASTMQTRQEIRFTLSAPGGEDAEDAEDVFIKPGSFRLAAEIAADKTRNNITFSSKLFDSQERFFQYFKEFATNIDEIRLETNDVDNYNQEFVFTKMLPTGEIKENAFPLNEFKVESSKATGFSDTVIIPGSKLSFLLWSGCDWMLSKMKAGSKINFFIKISGEQRAVALTPMVNEVF